MSGKQDKYLTIHSVSNFAKPEICVDSRSQSPENNAQYNKIITNFNENNEE